MTPYAIKYHQRKDGEKDSLVLKILHYMIRSEGERVLASPSLVTVEDDFKIGLTQL